jgi:hypothetical protein
VLAPIIAALAALAGGPVVVVQPGVVPLRHPVSVTVVGIAAPTLEVHLQGSSVALGHAMPWTRLHKTGDVWEATLPAPEFRGVYPVELRVRAGSAVLRDERWILRVFATGTLARPSFATPEEVASWWVRTVPPGAKLFALKRWPTPSFDLRDPRLHQLMVVAYDGPRGRLGIFVTAVRDRIHGRWRLLEATASP